MKLLQRVYNKFKLIDDNEIAYFWLKKEDFDKTGATASDTEGLIDHVRAIEPVVVACVFEELEPELTRISLRSKDKNVNVSDVAGLFGVADTRPLPGRASLASRLASSVA